MLSDMKIVRVSPDARLEELALQSPNGTIDTDSLRQIRLDEQVKDPVMSILTGDLLHMLLVSTVQSTAAAQRSRADHCSVRRPRLHLILNLGSLPRAARNVRG